MPSTADDVLAEIRSAALRVAAVRLRRYGLDSLSVMRQWYYWPGDIPNDFVPLPVAADRKLTPGGCGAKLGLLGGSSCTHTKIAFEQLGST